MKRTPLRPSLKPIGRSGPPRATGTPIRARKKDPAKRRWAKHRNAAFRRWIREHPCVVAGRLSGFIGRHRCTGSIECAHVVGAVSTGADDVGCCIPLCSGAHRGADWSPHRGGIQSFAEQFDLDLEKLAKSYADRWLAHQEGA